MQANSKLELRLNGQQKSCPFFYCQFNPYTEQRDYIMKQLSVIIISLSLFNLYGMTKTPSFIARISNESKNIFLMSGYNEENTLQSDFLSPGSKINFYVADEQTVKISSPTGIYLIYLHSISKKSHNPSADSSSNFYAVFEKIKAGKVSNKIGPVRVFRKYFPFKFREHLDFQLLLDDTLVLLTDKHAIQEDVATQELATLFESDLNI